MIKHEGVPVPPVAMAAAAVVQRFTPKGRRARKLRRAAATVLAAASGAVVLATVAEFKRRGTTLDPAAPATATFLVTDGTNALSRNPMYLAGVGLLAAGALARGSWRAWLPVGGLVLVLDRWQIPTEERALLGRFGEAYERYCAETPRWLDARSLDALKRH